MKVKQYCKYCAELTVGDQIYCSAHKEEMTKNQTNALNHCNDFNFTDINAFTGKKYVPRNRKKMDGQINLPMDTLAPSKEDVPVKETVVKEPEESKGVPEQYIEPVITVGMLQSRLRISANLADRIYQVLVENSVISKKGKVHDRN